MVPVSIGWGPRVNRKFTKKFLFRGRLSTSIHLPLRPDCRHHVTCLPLLLPHLPGLVDPHTPFLQVACAKCFVIELRKANNTELVSPPPTCHLLEKFWKAEALFFPTFTFPGYTLNTPNLGSYLSLATNVPTLEWKQSSIR